MKIWKMESCGNEKHWGFDIKSDKESSELMYAFAKNFGDVRYNGNWPRLYMKCVKEKDTYGFGNAMMLGSYEFIFKARIVEDERLYPFLAQECEAIPFSYKQERFYLLNVPNLSGCLLDTKKISYRYPEAKNDTTITFSWFDLEKISGHHLFIDKTDWFSGVFITDQFKDAYEQTGYGNLRFIEVWDGETEGQVTDQVLYRRAKEKYEWLTSRMHVETPYMDVDKYSDEELEELFVQGFIQQTEELLSQAEDPQSLQVFFYFDGDAETLQVEVDLLGPDEELNRAVWQGESCFTLCMCERLRRLYTTLPDDEDIQYEASWPYVEKGLLNTMNRLAERHPELTFMEIEPID